MPSGGVRDRSLSGLPARKADGGVLIVRREDLSRKAQPEERSDDVAGFHGRTD